MEEEPRRSPLEVVAIALFGVAYFAFAVAFFIGLPTLAIVRALDYGVTVTGVLWGAFAALFLGIVAYALVRDRETRGWILFALLGWLSLVPALANALRKVIRRGA